MIHYDDLISLVEDGEITERQAIRVERSRIRAEERRLRREELGMDRNPTKRGERT